jgi:outer membrane protein OmpA-like peptidoglycan-associated protein
VKTHLKYITIASLIVFAAGCSSTPVIPDGSDRTSINSPDKIESYKQSNANEINGYYESTVLSRKYELVIQQLAELKAEILALQFNIASKQKPAKKNDSTRIQSFNHVKPLNEKINDGETVEIRQNSILFRFAHPLNKTSLNPSITLEKQLLKAALLANRIEIRGRTDARVDNEINRKIASKRASNASNYLQQHGIDSNKISCSYLASGDHIAENRTSKGRSKNRRVDIEVFAEGLGFNNQAPGQIKNGNVQEPS